MSQYELHSVGKPSDTELAQAIAQLSGNAGIPPEQLMQAALVIVGEACSLMGEDGKSQDEVIASLAARGMPSESSTPLVEKAAEIVNSSSSNPALMNDAPSGNRWPLVFIGIAVVLVIAYFWLS